MSPFVPLLAALALLAGPAFAETRMLAPGEDLAAAIARAAPGDEILLGAGRHAGPVTIERALTLRGEPGAILEGDGTGHVITVTGTGITVTGLTIRGSGSDRTEIDAGIFLDREAREILIEDNILEGNLNGIRVQGAAGSVVRGNHITGRTGRQAEAGNGIAIWNAPGTLIENNVIRFGRDGIFSNVSKQDIYRGNRMEKTRFAIHYMYTNNSVIEGNVSVDNTVGYAMMFSNRLRIRDNVSDGDRDHGLLLNSVNYSEITGNRVIGRALPEARWFTSEAGAAADSHMGGADVVEARASRGGMRSGPEKCLFVYNANNNQLRDNWFEGCGIGLHFTAGAAGNTLSGNAFISNQVQVKYVGTRDLDWSEDGRGNYWSDNAAFDLDGDGIADAAYRPNDIIDQVMWTAPQARLLVTSPAVQVIRWAQARFPATLPGGVVDSAPLMAPPPLPSPEVNP